ncbi:MAG TPA: hypothetical protein DDY91_22175 [Planctomycetaceae bacterium]|jgi:hypothetical protein|nr:hypothetical protein [Planctomycetaceae bacterium]
MTDANSRVLLWTGLGFCVVGLLSHGFARDPLAMVRVLTGQTWRRVPSRWQTDEWKRAMHFVGWSQVVLGAGMALLGGWSSAR